MKKVGNYTLYQVLGKGSFGEVYLTKKDNSPEILATKKLDKKQTDRPSVKKYFDNEIAIMKELNHPNIVRFYDLLASYSHYYVVMEYCNGGGLSNCLKKYKQLYHKPFSQEIVQYLMRQIVEGLRYIHSKKIIHRDIKLDNILVKFYNESDINNLNMLASHVKIIDFGLATHLGPEDLTFTALGSPINMDPLILKKYNKAGGYEMLQGYNEKADIWSLGTICYEMLTGEALFKVRDIKELMKKVEKGNYTIPLNMNLSKETVSFLNSMLQYNGDDRLSADELAQHDFLTKNVKQFSKVDLAVISNKIDRNGININVKQNQTIWNLFNEDNPQEVIPYMIQNQQNKQSKDYNKHKSPEKIGHIKEQKYIFSNNIYEYQNNYNTHYNQNMQPQENKKHRRMTEGNIYQNKNNIPLENHHRFTEGFISPFRNIEKRKEFGKINEKEKEKNKINEIRKIEIKKENIIKDYEKRDSEKSKKEIDELKKYLNGLYEEYKSAENYFKENDLKAQEEDASQRCLQIQNIKSQLEKGYSLHLNALPKPITPEYIYGYSAKERENKFNEVISKYTDDKNELENKIKEAILNLKKLDGENYTKMKAKMMPILESEKEKLDKIKKVIEAFQIKFKNEWIPAPKISKDIQGFQIEKVSNDKDNYKLKIYVGKTDYKKDNLILNIVLQMDNDKLLNKEVRLKSIGNFDEEIIWVLNSNEWENIDKYLFVLEYYYVDRNERVAVSLNISKIKEMDNLLYECPIDLYAENIRVKIILNIKREIPEDRKNVDQGKKEIITIKKIYPAFKGKSPDTNNIPNLLS